MTAPTIPQPLHPTQGRTRVLGVAVSPQVLARQAPPQPHSLTRASSLPSSQRRSPGDVPRTPSLGNGRKSSKGEVMKAAALNVQTGNRGGKGPVVIQPPTPTQNNNDPNSPLNKVSDELADGAQEHVRGAYPRSSSLIRHPDGAQEHVFHSPPFNPRPSPVRPIRPSPPAPPTHAPTTFAVVM